MNNGTRREPDKLLVSLERLTELTLNKIEEGSRNKLLTVSETRLLVGVTLRCLRLWRELRGKEPLDPTGLEDELQRIKGIDSVEERS